MFKRGSPHWMLRLVMMAGLLLILLTSCSCDNNDNVTAPSPKSITVTSSKGSQLTVPGSTSVKPPSAREQLDIDDIDQGEIGTTYPALPGGSKAAAVVNVTPNNVQFSPPVTLKFKLPTWYQPATKLNMFHLAEGGTQWEPIAAAEVDGTGLVAEGKISSTSLYAVAEPREPPTQEPLRLSLDRSTDTVYAGECSKPHSVVLVAHLSGSPEAIAEVEVEWAALRYRWEGVEEQLVEMERVDDLTFSVQIGDFDYCCQTTTIVYSVELYDRSGAPLISESGSMPLEFCID